MSADLPLIVSNYKLRRSSGEPSSTEWVQICPSNPSRWHLQIVQRKGSNAVCSPFTDAPLPTGILLPAEGATLAFAFRDSPSLCCAAWFVSTQFPVAGNSVEAWETTLAGT